MKLLTLLVLLVGIALPNATFAEEVVKIATIYPLSGTYSTGLRQPKIAQSVALAVEALNQQGGLLGRKIEVLEFDSRSTPLGARAAAHAAARSKPLAVIGDRYSTMSLAIAPVLQRDGIIMISPTSTHIDLTRAGDYIFRTCFLDAAQGQALANLALKKLNLRRAVVLTNVNTKSSESLSRDFIERFVHGGGQVLMQGEYTQDRADFGPLLTKVKNLHPDMILVPGYSKDSGMLIRQARSIGIDAVFFGGDGWGEAIREYAGEAIVGSYSTAHWHRSSSRPISQEFVSRFEKRHGPLHSEDEALVFDAVMTLADAVRRANSLDVTKVRDELARTKNLPLISGDLSFDRDRNAIKPVAILRYFKKHTEQFDLINP